MGRSRDDRGQFDDRVRLNDVRTLFQDREDPARPLTAGDVEEAIDCARSTANNKLTELVDRGLIETKKVGARSRVYWKPQSNIFDELEAKSDSEDSDTYPRLLSPLRHIPFQPEIPDGNPESAPTRQEVRETVEEEDGIFAGVVDKYIDVLVYHSFIAETPEENLVRTAGSRPSESDLDF